jgi:hypothetical protein
MRIEYVGRIDGGRVPLGLESYMEPRTCSPARRPPISWEAVGPVARRAEAAFT